MKKKSLKLRLSRETLHSLDPLKEAVGGSFGGVSCYWASCDNCSPFPSYGPCTMSGDSTPAQ